MSSEPECNQCMACHASGQCPGCDPFAVVDPHQDPTYLHPREDVEAKPFTEPQDRWVEFYGFASDGRALFVEVDEH